MKLKFTKMQGAGNDYIYVDVRNEAVSEPEKLSVMLSRPHYGIGSDGLVLIGKSDEADFSMRIFNADGSEALMCGNASRCVGKYVYERSLTDKTAVTLETLSGIKILNLHPDAEGKVSKVTVDMGAPEGMREIPLTGYGFDTGIALSVGNPHLVIPVADVENIALTVVGPTLEHHPLFPDRVNVEFAQVFGDGNIRMRVWERGSGVTMACGTGACATAVAAAFAGLSGRSSRIVMDGGALEITWDEATGHVFMTGPAEEVFEGTVEI